MQADSPNVIPNEAEQRLETTLEATRKADMLDSEGMALNVIGQLHAARGADVTQMNIY